jgi:hypothetical protein
MRYMVLFLLAPASLLMGCGGSSAVNEPNAPLESYQPFDASASDASEEVEASMPDAGPASDASEEVEASMPDAGPCGVICDAGTTCMMVHHGPDASGMVCR